MASHQSLTIHVPPGPIGIGVQQQGINGRCVVTKTFPTTTSKKPSPLLRVGDVILSLNGITLEDVEGGAGAWVKLFVAFGAVDRKLIVQRAVVPANNKADNISTSLKNQKKVHLNNDSHTANKKQKIDTTNDSHASKMDVISLLDDTTDEEEGVSSGSEVEVVPVSSSSSTSSTSAIGGSSTAFRVFLGLTIESSRNDNDTGASTIAHSCIIAPRPTYY